MFYTYTATCALFHIGPHEFARLVAFGIEIIDIGRVGGPAPLSLSKMVFDSKVAIWLEDSWQTGHDCGVALVCVC